MRILVIGGGVIGVTTAFELSRGGAEVTLIEREADVALATSAGNAGVIAPGYVTPWAAPGMPTKILRYLFQPTAPVIYRPRLDRQQWAWVRAWLSECTLARYRTNKPRMQRLAYYSQARLAQFRARYPFDYGRSEGYLQLFRSAYDEELVQPALKMLAEAGVPHRRVTASECVAIEPALAFARTPPHAGLYLPDDEAGDCARFTRALRSLAESQGTRFRLGTEVEAIECSASRVDAVVLRSAEGRRERLGADVVVVAAGVESRTLLRPLGIRVPLYAVKGYSVTLPVRNEARAPRAVLMDEAYKTAITRMGASVRVAGTAELSDDRLKVRPRAARTLMAVLEHWFPGAADTSAPHFWVGRRPMTPDGPPLLGPAPIKGLFLNLGHGSTGWAMSMGSARIVADLIEGRPPEIDLSGLTLERYRTD